MSTSSSDTSATGIRVRGELPTGEVFIPPAYKTDYLKVDPPIRQKWAILQFVSPEEILVKKTLYLMNRFLVNYVNSQVEGQAVQIIRHMNVQLRNNFESQLSRFRRSEDSNDHIIADRLDDILTRTLLPEDHIVKECQRSFKLDEQEMMDAYLAYHGTNYHQLEDQFNEMYGKQITIRGVKCSGTFESKKDAERMSQNLVKYEPGTDKLICPVGYWVPFDPNPMAIPMDRAVFAERNLQHIMKTHLDNEDQSRRFVEDRKTNDLRDSDRRVKQRETRAQLAKERVKQKKLELERAKVEKTFEQEKETEKE